MNLDFVHDAQFLVNYNLLYCKIKLIFLNTIMIWIKHAFRKKIIIIK